MSDVPRQLPPKKEVALALLEGPSLLIHLDPRREGVSVPKWFMGQAQLVLQVGLNLPVPIPDLTVDEEGISCTLSFNRSPFWCRIPWGAVYALVGEDGRGMVWPNDVPPEVAQQMQRAAAAPPAKAGKKPKAKLAAVKDSDRESQRSSSSPRSRSKQEARSPEPEPTEPAAEASTPEEAAPERRPEKGPRPLTAHSGPGPAEAASAPEASGDEARDEARDAGKGQKPRSIGPGDKKPKRELPPYLRVIK